MTEELWYPEFGLRDDPFQYNDFNHEYYVTDEIPRIKTEEVKRIKDLRPTCSIVGYKGDGKSTALWLSVLELERDRHLFHSIASPSLTSFYNELFNCLYRFYHKKKKAKEIFEKSIDKNWFEVHTKMVLDTQRLDWINCHYPHCILRRRCKIPLKEPTDVIEHALDHEYLHWVLQQIEKYCPLKVHLVQKLIENLPNVEEGRYKFLLDVPDDLHYGIDDFKDTVRNMQSVGNAIIMTTHEQHERLTKSDFFSRFVKFEFLQMTNEELKQLYHARIKWQQKEGNYPPLLTEEALDFAVRKSIRNPRFLLMICEEVISSMKIQGRVSSADVKFIEKASKTVGLFSVNDYVSMLVKRYKENRKRWVKVKESVRDMREWFNFETNEWSLGRKLANLYRKGVISDHKSGDEGSEYLYYTGSSDEVS